MEEGKRVRAMMMMVLSDAARGNPKQPAFLQQHRHAQYNKQALLHLYVLVRVCLRVSGNKGWVCCCGSAFVKGNKARRNHHPANDEHDDLSVLRFSFSFLSFICLI